MADIKYYKFNYSDFEEGEHGLFLRGIWAYPRLEPRYKTFYLPTAYCAFKKLDDELYIVATEWEQFEDRVLSSIFKLNSIPEPIGDYIVDFNDWMTFKSLYPYENKGVPQFNETEQ